MGHDRVDPKNRTNKNGIAGAPPDDSDSQLVDAAWRQFAAIVLPARVPSSGVAGSMQDRPFSLPPDSFTGYRILREIHRGGQGIVYEAIQESTDRTVAIKVLKQGPFAGDAELARFEREVHVLSRLNHPNIVTIHDRGMSAGNAYLVMDYVPGRALDQYLAGIECPQKTVLLMFAKICEAVHAAHLRGIIHRDLKPGNIRIDDSGEPHVLDFGLAKLTDGESDDSSAQPLTITGQFVGSMPWSSPEQAMGKAHDIDLRTDVYSLGVILYQMLTGAFPYVVTGLVREVQDRILHSEPVRPSSIARSIDSDLETIVLKCLAKLPERRYQSAGELALDIRHFLAGEPIGAKRDSFSYVLRKQLSRHRGATAVAVAFVALIAIGLAYCVAQWRRADNEAVRAKRAQGEALARANEVEQVAKFQETQLADIDVMTMGLRIRSDLLDAARTAAERSKLPPAEVISRLASMENAMAGADFTGVALDALEESYFQPALKAIETQFAGQPIVKAQLLQTLADTLLEVGLLDIATAPQTEALAIRRRELGDDHPDTLTSVAGMGLLIRDHGKNEEAEPFYREALDKRRAVLGEDHPDTLSSLQNMGSLLQAQHRLAEAEEYYRESLERRRRTLGEDHKDTLTSMSGMGHLLVAQGKWAEAVPYWREVLEKRRRVLGEEHPHTLFAISNMATLFHTQHKFDDAEKLYKESLEKRRRLLGDNHPDTLQSINNLATMFYDQKRLADAEPLYHEALERRRRILGSDHPSTLNSISGMGGFLMTAGRLEEAEPYTREALERRRRVLPVDHPDILNSMNNMAALLDKLGRADEAIGLYRETLDGNRRSRGEDNPYTFMAAINLSTTLRKYGKATEEVELLSSLEPVARRKYSSPNAPQLGRFLLELGHAQFLAGKFDDAETTLLEANEIMNTVANDPRWNSIDSLHEMVQLYEAWHVAEPNAGHGAKANEWRAKVKALESTAQPAE